MTDTTLTVTMDLCADADTTTKDQVHLDHTAPYATDADRDGDTVVDENDFCFPTKDAIMKHRGKKNTGPGTITVAGRSITFAASFAELGISPPASATPLLVWATTKRPGTQDHAPNTEGGDGCSRPESAQEVLKLPATPPPLPEAFDRTGYEAFLAQTRIDNGLDTIRLDGSPGPDGTAFLEEIQARVAQTITDPVQAAAKVQELLQLVDADGDGNWSSADDIIRFAQNDGVQTGDPDGVLTGSEGELDHLQAILDLLSTL